MVDLVDVSSHDIITSARQNLINDYIQDGVHDIITAGLTLNGVLANEKKNVIFLGATVSPVSSDTGKTYVCQTLPYSVYLPAYSVSSDLGTFYTFIKADSGTLTIQAPSGETIADSTSSGYIYDDQTGETWATITLQRTNSTQWIVTGGHGTWVTA